MNVSTISILAVILCATSLVSSPYVTAEVLSIKLDKTSVRLLPDPKGKVLWELSAGFPVELVKKQGDWLQIKDFENDSGWIHKSRISKTTTVIVRANKNEEQSINIRSNPSLNASIVGTAYYGVVFFVLERKDGWIKVRHDSGLVGWIKSDLLWGQ
jgi:SH3-like domain-containing protein